MGLSAMFLLSCDAANHLQYAVKNKTDKIIRLHIPSYPVDSNQGEFSVKVDTLIEIRPNESIWVGSSPLIIDFPWATKKIYIKNPGLCGLELLEKDKLIQLDCTSANWKYKKRRSTLTIK